MTKTLKAKLITLGLFSALTLSLLAFAGYHYYRANLAQSRLDTRTAELNDLQGKYATAQTSLDYVRTQDETKRKALQQQQARQHELETLTGQHLQKIRSLQYELDELREWSTQPLPDFIRRLHNHPAITTTADYTQHLQHTQSLQADRDKPAHEW